MVGRKLGFDIQKISKKLYLKYYKKQTEAKNLICIFSKPPIAGMTKSRLAKSIGEVAAADLAAAMLRDIIEQVLAVPDAELFIAHPPENNSDEFKFLKYSNINFIAQSGVDLGERMSNVFADLLTRQNLGKAIIIGSDCITVSSEKLQTGFANLSKFPVIIEPAEDGGYVLVGQSVFCAEMFKEVAWGTDTVMEQTRKKLNKAEINFFEFPISFDIDHYDDLSKLASFIQHNSRSHTKKFMDRLHPSGY